MYRASAAVLEGVMHTMTADGLKEVEEEEGKIITEERIGFTNTFAPTFFDFECLLANGTGDPCDAYVAEAFADQMFVPLRTDSLVGQTYISQNLFENISCLLKKRNFRKYSLSGYWRAHP